MPPYLRKVAKLNQPIVLIDCFAGPGRFDDGQPGSPLIMCNMAEQYGNRNCACIFVNENRSHHEKLEEAIRGFREKGLAVAIHGDSGSLLEYVQPKIKGHTLFIYLDPFGLQG